MLTFLKIINSPNSSLFGPQFVAEENPRYRSNSRLRNNVPSVQSQFLGKIMFFNSNKIKILTNLID